MDIVKNLYKKNKLDDIKPLQPTCSHAFIFAGGGSSSSGNKPIFSFPGWGRLGWGDKSSGGSPSLTGLALPIQIWKGGVKHA